MISAEYDLGRLQAWMQAVIMHPGGVAEGIDSAEARQHISTVVDDLESVINRSTAQTSVERMEIYARAYYARLLECLRAEFPVMVLAMGEDLFDEFAVDYLQHYPSQSYTLGRLGAHFADYLREARPEDEPHDQAAAWPDFLVDLARLEWTFDEVFDGPGPETETPLDPDQLLSIPVEQWPEARLVPSCCLRLLSFRYPIHTYYHELRRKREATPPDPAETLVAVSRENYIVRSHELSLVQYRLLQALSAGAALQDALQSCALGTESRPETFAAELASWFRYWAAEGFFRSVELSPDMNSPLQGKEANTAAQVVRRGHAVCHSSPPT